MYFALQPKIISHILANAEYWCSLDCKKGKFTGLTWLRWWWITTNTTLECQAGWSAWGLIHGTRQPKEHNLPAGVTDEWIVWGFRIGEEITSRNNENDGSTKKSSHWDFHWKSKSLVYKDTQSEYEMGYFWIKKNEIYYIESLPK